MSSSFTTVLMLAQFSTLAQDFLLVSASQQQQRVPSAPRSVEVTQINSTAIRVSWKPPERENGELFGYYVYKDLLVNGQHVNSPVKAVAIADKNKLYAFVTDLEPNSEYAIRVVAVSRAGDGEYSASRRVITGGRPPSSPRIQSINVLGREHPIQAKIEWLPPMRNYSMPITRYLLWYKPVDVGVYERVQILPTVTSFVLSNLHSGQEYEVHLSAVNSVGMSENATEKFVTPEGIPSGEPLNIRYTIMKKHLSVLWDPPLWFHRNGNISHYHVVFKTLISGRSGRVTEQNVSSPMAVFEVDSERGQGYSFKVAAATSIGRGPYSTPININADSRTSIGPPRNVRVQAISNSSAVVEWDFDESSSSDGVADGFVVKYIHEPNQHSAGGAHRPNLIALEKWRSQTVMDPRARHLELTRLLPQKPYAFCVLAIRQSRLGPCSEPPVLIERLQPTYVVENLRIQYKTSQSVAFQWDYNGPSAEGMGFYIKQMGMKSYLDQYLEEKTLVSPGFERRLDATERYFLWQSLRPYMNYTFQVGLYSLDDGRTYWPKELTVHTDPTGPPFIDAPEFIHSESPSSVQVRLSCASEEYGPISHYWLIVIPSNYSKEDVMNVESGQLQRSTAQYRLLKVQGANNASSSGVSASSAATQRQRKDLGDGRRHGGKSRRQLPATSSSRRLDGIYIAAQLASHKVQRLQREDRSFLLGDGRDYEGYMNFPLDDSMHYSLMARAFAKEDTWRSAAANNPFDYRPPMQEPASRLFADSILSEPFSTRSGDSSLFGTSGSARGSLVLVGPAIAILVIFVMVGMLVVWWLKCSRRGIGIGGLRIARPPAFRTDPLATKSALKSSEFNNGAVHSEETSNLLMGMDSDGRPIVNSTMNAYDGPIGTNINDTNAMNVYELEMPNHYTSSTLGRSKYHREESQQDNAMVTTMTAAAVATVPREEDGFGAHLPTSASATFSPIPLSELATHMDRLKMNNNALFIQEFESIETGHSFTWENSSMEVNKPKNRYANVVAYDHSRVILSMDERGTPGSDYINANYIDGYDKPKAYIATQGPLPETFVDFWRMMWEEASATIVMLTRLEERSRSKCDQYWPSRGSSVYGGFRVHLLSTVELAHYCIRTMRLENVRMRETREIKHFQFTGWPDHGVPHHPTPFLMFLKRVKSLNPPDVGPIVTHCSAGVGRTGAFIVIDCMLDRLRYESTVDVYGCVRDVRTQRSYMVQTDDQYIFIYDAVLDAAQSGSTEVPSARLPAHVKVLSHPQPQMADLSGMQIEFRTLITLCPSTGRCITANMMCNAGKNRSSIVVPFDYNRVLLPYADVDGSDYINASWIDSYRARNAYIATQAPLPNTTSDFWQMVYSQECSIVVMLSRLFDGRGSGHLHEYWPNGRGEDYGGLIVDCVSEFDMSSYMLREFKITDGESGRSRTLRQFHYMDWPERSSVPQSPNSFVDFVRQVHQTKAQFGSQGPICIHCINGAGRTGVFIAVSTILERIKQEKVVDVFTSVKLLRIQRPLAVENEEQYRFCYDAAIEFIQAFDDSSFTT